VSIYVPLRREAKERLIELARAERRRPADQAAILLERALRDAEQQREHGAEVRRLPAPA